MSPRALALTLLALAGGLGLARSAGHAGTSAPGRVSGTLTFRWSEGGSRGSATYTLTGPVMTLAQRSGYDPPRYPPGYRAVGNGRLFLPAHLTAFSFSAPVAVPCTDGSTAAEIEEATVVVDAKAVFSHDERLVVDRLHGRGSTALVPDARDLWADNAIVGGTRRWRGLGSVTVTTRGTPCAGEALPQPKTMRVDELIPQDVLTQWSPERLLPVRGSSALAVSSGWSASAPGLTARLTVRARLLGALPDLGAACTWPTTDDLAPARTLAQADAILARAGLVTRFGGDKADADVPKGHFYVEAGSPWPCGTPSGTMLFRSLGRL